MRHEVMENLNGRCSRKATFKLAIAGFGRKDLAAAV